MTADDLKQLRQLLREEVTPIVSNLKKELIQKIEVVENNLNQKIEVVESKLTQKIETVESNLNQKIETVELKTEVNITRLTKLEKTITLLEKENKNEHREIMEYLIENSEHLERRIEKLERHTGLSNKN